MATTTLTPSVDTTMDRRFVGEQLLGYIHRGETDKVAQASNDITRVQVREGSFMGHFLPYQSIGPERLDRDLTEGLQVIEDVEPDSPGGMYAPLRTLPQQHYVSGGRYPIRFARLMTRTLKKDVAELYTYPHDLIDMLMDNQIKDALAELDGAFTQLCESIWSNTAGGVPGANVETGKVQWTGHSGGLTISNLVKARNMLMRGNARGKFRMENHCVLMNNITAQDYLLLEDTWVGDSKRGTMFNDGLTQNSILGLDHVFTIKDDLIPDNVALFFPKPEFLGRAYYLEDWTTFVERKAHTIETFATWLGGFGIGNLAGVCYADFDV